MRKFYNILAYLLVPVVLLRLLWRSRRLSGYRKRWLERFAYFSFYSTKPVIWVHAVSVGEVLAAVPLVKLLSQQLPEYQLVVTSTTPTGSERVQANLPSSVFHIYAPYDLSGVIQRFLKKVKPKILILMETELWPNLLYYCARENVPVLLANARLSERSLRGYSRIRPIAREMLQSIHTIAAQSTEDAERFKKLGADPLRVQVTGNVKFEMDISPSLFENGELLRQQFGHRPTWIAASTHEGEEEQVLEAHAIIRKAIPHSLLILVPRHPDRFDRVADLIEKMGWKCVRRSQASASNFENADVFLGDTMGELRLFFAASDVAFVGGSLIPHGGHNTLEPAVFSLPIISGPHVFNFSQITQLLKAAHGLLMVETAEILAAEVIALFLNPAQRAEMGEAAVQVVNSNKGAVERYCILVKRLLEA